MSKTNMAIIAVVVVVVLGALYFFMQGGSAPASQGAPTGDQTQVQPQGGVPADAGMPQGGSPSDAGAPQAGGAPAPQPQGAGQ